MAIAPTVDNTWGAAFIGLLLAAMWVPHPSHVALTEAKPDSLYGITFVQTYIYFSTYPEDGLEFKFMAGAAL
jgi:hypothetical protein